MTCIGCAWHVLRVWTDSDRVDHFTHLCSQCSGSLVERWDTTLSDFEPPACNERWCE